MADGAVSFLLEKLTTLVTQKAAELGDAIDRIEEIKLELESMRAFLKDADRRKESNEGVGSWVRQVRDVAHDVEDVIDEFMHHKDKWRRRNGINGMVHHAFHLPKIFFSSQRITSKLEKIKAKVYDISERSKRYGFDKIDERKSSIESKQQYHGDTSMFVDEDEIVGMEENEEELLQWLSEDEPRRTIISILGMGGLGKTTLVTKVYNDQIVKRQFDCWAWISVSQTYRIEELLQGLIKEFIDKMQMVVPRNMGSMNYRQLVDVLINYLHQKRYVVVLDDVWSIDFWSKVRVAFPNNKCGSRVILTTRNENVASSVGIGSRVHRLEPLLETDAWSLFCKKAFWSNHERTCPQQLTAIAQVIVKKCEGLPLAIVAIGGLMSSRDQTVVEWRKVYESLNWQLNNNAMLESVKSILLLSFNDLPFYLKHCFLYCSVFRDGYPIKRKKLIRLWVAEGFIEERKGMTMEEVAEDYLKELIFRSMIQVTTTNDAGRVKKCRLHDFMRELALSTSEKDNFCTAYDGIESRLDGRVLRLSIYNSGQDVRLSRSTSQHLRSVFVFQTNISTFSFNVMLSNFKLLRVLDLQGASVETLPDEVVGLFHLRYLNLRETKVRELPKSIGRLKNLQTLDIRNTYVERLPDGVTKLLNLRHLYMYRYSDGYLGSVKTPAGISNLQSLQTLARIEAEEDLIEQVGNLTDLRRFEVTKLKAGDGFKLCTSIEKMSSLLYLGVMASNEQEEIQMEFLSPPCFLQKLTIGGLLKRLPHWLGSVSNLTHLHLGSSRLSEDIIPSIRELSCLVFLELNKAYEGQVLHFHSGLFPRLNKLKLCELPQLNCVRVDEGALLNIRLLYLIRCPELKVLPLGIEHLTRLQKLHLEEMPEELVQNVQDEESEDRLKVQHIPIIKHVCFREQNWVVETLS